MGRRCGLQPPIDDSGERVRKHREKWQDELEDAMVDGDVERLATAVHFFATAKSVHSPRASNAAVQLYEHGLTLLHALGGSLGDAAAAPSGKKQRVASTSVFDLLRQPTCSAASSSVPTPLATECQEHLVLRAVLAHVPSASMIGEDVPRDLIDAKVLYQKIANTEYLSTWLHIKT